MNTKFPVQILLGCALLALTTTLALSETATASSTGYGSAPLTIDGIVGTNSYWASTSFPATLTIDLGSSQTINEVKIALPTTWGARSQTYSISGSTDGVNYTTLAGAQSYSFNASTNNNVATAGFGATTARYVMVTFTGATPTTSAQVSEIVIDNKIVPAVYIPTLNPNESVVAFATPQQFGAKGDGTTDDTAAFQNAINAASNAGGGVIYVPKATYAFYGNLNVPRGVSLHGDWTDWTTGSGGCVGTTFAIYGGSGQANGTPFITMNISTGLSGINFWYPNQNPNSITAYPFTIDPAGDAFVQNIVLINSYQGINADGAAHHFIQTVIGSPLFMGFFADHIYDVNHLNDIRFSPNVWPASHLAGAPAAGGAYATWMRKNGTGIRLYRVDGEFTYGITISGYKVGIEMNNGVNGSPSCNMYQANVTNCAIALMAQHGESNGNLFTACTFDGDLAISRTASNHTAFEFNNCTITGRTGTAINMWGNDSTTKFLFQNCAITATIQPNGCIFNLVDCTLTCAGRQCIMGSNVNTRAYFTGCTFSPSQNITNYGSAGNLQVTPGQSATNTLPLIPWSTFTTQYAACKPAKTTLFLASSYGATGNGATDDTAAIQSALTAAGNNGGGIVYLSSGKYNTSNTLTVPSGVRLQGTWEGWHSSDGWSSYNFGSIIQPAGGQGATTGPVAVALSANSGIVGITLFYATQNSSLYPFPPTIQGQGANVYVIGVMCSNPYTFLDLDTYTCTNHFVDMVGGWAISRYITVGHGSSGSIVNVGALPGYWSGNPSTAKFYAKAFMQLLTMGDCTETVASVFVFQSHTLIYCTAENSRGPNLTAIGLGQDDSVSSFMLDSAAASTINIINAGNEQGGDSSSPYPSGQSAATFFIQSTSQFAGTARFFNMASWGAPASEFIINSGDVGVDTYFADESSSAGPTVNGGVFHLVNYTDFNGNPYTVTFGASAGISGKTNEVIGNLSSPGIASNNLNLANPVNAWGNYVSSSGGPQNGIFCSLLCQSSGMALDNGGSTSQGATVKQWTASGGNPNQQWQMTSVGSGYYNLICQKSGMGLDTGGSTTNGASLIQGTLVANNLNQGWKFVNVGGLYPYQIINQADGKAMDNGGSTSTGTTVNQLTQAGGSSSPSQNWRVMPLAEAAPMGGLVYHLVCVTSGMALDNGGSTTGGTTLKQSADQVNDPNQEWQLMGVGDYYNLICLSSGMALDNAGGTGNGSNVYQNPLQANNPNQAWAMLLGNGSCSLISVSTGLALDNGGSTVDGHIVYQWAPQLGNNNQAWQFIDNEAAPQTGSTFNLICQKSGMAMDNGGSTTAGAAIVQQPLQAGDTNQQWKFDSVGDGSYAVVCATSGMAMDNSGSTTQGTNVKQWTESISNLNQEWRLTLLP